MQTVTSVPLCERELASREENWAFTVIPRFFPRNHSRLLVFRVSQCFGGMVWENLQEVPTSLLPQLPHRQMKRQSFSWIKIFGESQLSRRKTAQVRLSCPGKGSLCYLRCHGKPPQNAVSVPIPEGCGSLSGLNFAASFKHPRTSNGISYLCLGNCSSKCNCL